VRYERADRILEEATQLALADLAEPEAAGSALEAAGLALAINEAARILNYVAVSKKGHHAETFLAASSVSRVATATALRAVAEAEFELLGAETFLHEGLDQHVVTSMTTPIAAGTYEIQLNNVARHCLALPRS
jgi:alkylation response protein AidB-like acyl-CoA dehydrogenase